MKSMIQFFSDNLHILFSADSYVYNHRNTHPIGFVRSEMFVLCYVLDSWRHFHDHLCECNDNTRLSSCDSHFLGFQLCLLGMIFWIPNFYCDLGCFWMVIVPWSNYIEMVAWWILCHAWFVVHRLWQQVILSVNEIGDSNDSCSFLLKWSFVEFLKLFISLSICCRFP